LFPNDGNLSKKEYFAEILKVRIFLVPPYENLRELNNYTIPPTMLVNGLRSIERNVYEMMRHNAIFICLGQNPYSFSFNEMMSYLVNNEVMNTIRDKTMELRLPLNEKKKIILEELELIRTLHDPDDQNNEYTKKFNDCNYFSLTERTADWQLHYKQQVDAVGNPLKDPQGIVIPPSRMYTRPVIKGLIEKTLGCQVDKMTHSYTERIEIGNKVIVYEK